MNQQEIEQMRCKLQEQLRHDYFDKLKNEEDPSAERYELIGTVSIAIDRLIEIETSFLSDLLGDMEDGICPSCLIKDSTDVANAKSVAVAFNNYITTSQNMSHE